MGVGRRAAAAAAAAASARAASAAVAAAARGDAIPCRRLSAASRASEGAEEREVAGVAGGVGAGACRRGRAGRRLLAPLLARTAARAPGRISGEEAIAAAASGGGVPRLAGHTLFCRPALPMRPRPTLRGRPGARAQPRAAAAAEPRRGAGAAVRAAAAAAPPTTASLADRVRPDFPALAQEVGGRPLLYLDSGATSQKPVSVLRAMDAYYERDNANVHRGVHALAARATASYESARARVAAFIGASSDRDLVFTRNATEGINIVAHAWGLANLKPGDEILVSVAEHHSNLVPWQLVAARTGARVRAVGLTPTQEIDVGAVRDALHEGRVKIVALQHVGNVTGALLPAAAVADICRAAGARLLLDCCQSLPGLPLDVAALGADWVVASAHKACGPTGIGLLWGKPDVLEAMPPFMGGGEMIDHVGIESSTFAPPPARFEPGTPPIAEAIGFGAAVEYLNAIGMDAVARHEAEVGGLLYEGLRSINGVTVYGPPPGPTRPAALASFNVSGLHATDISTLLDGAGVAVRSGHHCAQPLHAALGVSASARASPYIYTSAGEVDAFLGELKSAIQFFRDAGL